MNNMTKGNVIDYRYAFFFFFFADEDPALRELAELEREGCAQDIQDLRQRVEIYK